MPDENEANELNSRPTQEGGTIGITRIQCDMCGRMFSTYGNTYYYHNELYLCSFPCYHAELHREAGEDVVRFLHNQTREAVVPPEEAPVAESSNAKDLWDHLEEE